MPGAPVGSIMEVTLRTEAYSNIFLTVLHYVVSTQTDHADALADQVDFINQIEDSGPTDIVTSYMACQGSEAVLTQIRAQYVSPTRIAYSQKAKAIHGTYGSTIPATNVAAVITKRTAISGRKQVGGVHIPNLPAAAYSQGEVSGGMLVKMSTLQTALLQEIIQQSGPGDWNPVLWHRKDVPQPKSNLVVSLVNQPEVRTMHRRTVGLGI